MRLTWERFDPERLGYDALSRWLTEFYQTPPWNEYLKCCACGGRDDFGPEGTYGRPEVEANGLRSCPRCGGPLELFWSPDRLREYFRQLRSKGALLGFTVLAEQQPAAWIWGYEITPDTPAPWGSQGDGRGMYADVIHILPEHRKGLVIWYLIATILRQLRGNGYQYIVARTHRRAENMRILFQRLGFRELDACPHDPQRTYWVRALAQVIPDPLSQPKLGASR